MRILILPGLIAAAGGLGFWAAGLQDKRGHAASANALEVVLPKASAAAAPVKAAEIRQAPIDQVENNETDEPGLSRAFSTILEDSPEPAPRTIDRDQRRENLLEAVSADQELARFVSSVDKVDCGPGSCTITVTSAANPMQLAFSLITFAKAHRETNETLTMMTSDPIRPLKVSTSFEDEEKIGQQGQSASGQ